MKSFPSKSFSDNLKFKTGTELSRSIQNLKWIGVVAIAVTFAMCGVVAQAQQPGKVYRIGFLAAVAPASIAAGTEAFRQALRELGHVEGKNIVIESRGVVGKLDRLSELAAELVHLKVDVIVTTGPTSTRAAQGSNFYDSHCHGVR